MENYHGMRGKEQEIRDTAELKAILAGTQYVTIAMCSDNEPYLVSLSHGYDKENNAIYFHCAYEGKKIEILKANNRVWGQAIVDHGYVQGRCDNKPNRSSAIQPGDRPVGAVPAAGNAGFSKTAEKEIKTKRRHRLRRPAGPYSTTTR
jgi:hypothetical protein